MAINKPNEYETTQASGAFEPIALGGHRLIIKQVSWTPTRTMYSRITSLSSSRTTSGLIRNGLQPGLCTC